jgi:phosphohistidine phosphatase
MRLLLIRHADAGTRDPARWPDDTLRPLTARGRKRHQRVARRLKRRDLTPTLLLSSPWRRAWQTAEITAVTTHSPAPVACEALACDPELEAFRLAVGDEAVIGLVGHEPWLGELAALLLTGSTTGVAIDLPKSGVIGLSAPDLTARSATLDFFWRPRGS